MKKVLILVFFSILSIQTSHATEEKKIKAIYFDSTKMHQIKSFFGYNNGVDYEYTYINYILWQDSLIFFHRDDQIPDSIILVNISDTSQTLHKIETDYFLSKFILSNYYTIEFLRKKAKALLFTYMYSHLFYQNGIFCAYRENLIYCFNLINKQLHYHRFEGFIFDLKYIPSKKEIKIIEAVHWGKVDQWYGRIMPEKIFLHTMDVSSGELSTSLINTINMPINNTCLLQYDFEVGKYKVNLLLNGKVSIKDLKFVIFTKR